MFVKQFYVGGDRNFGYLVTDDASHQAAVIDPSYNPRMIVDFAQEHGYAIKYIFNTHGHHDHTNGNQEIETLTGKRPLRLGMVDAQDGILVEDDAVFMLGELPLKVLHTPGHSADSICLYVGDALFSGDTLFVGKVGGTDYDIGARAEYDSLHHKLMTLPDATRIFPGHDYGIAPQSTVSYERETNPFICQADFDAFVHLKRNWLAYKQEHGIQ